MNYYNEWDKDAAAWLRELIKAGLIPDGEVDDRSITEVKAHELTSFRQAHFFAGIGGWPVAFQLAGIDPDDNTDTGSCPCQPFSGTGKQMGFADPRHLWAAFRRIIGKRQPAKVYGEQVASKLGREWLSRVFSDLAFMGYAGTGADLCSAGVGSPNIRQRLYWVGDATKKGLQGGDNGPHEGRTGFGERCGVDRLEHPESDRHEQRGAESDGGSVAGGCELGGMAITHSQRLDGQHALLQRKEQGWVEQDCAKASGDSSTLRLGYADHARREGRLIRWNGGHECAAGSPSLGMWSDCELIFCRDQKWRRIESGSFPLADGIPSRVGPLLTELRKLGRGSIVLARANRNLRLKGYGNAINPHVAAAFIRAAEHAGTGLGRVTPGLDLDTEDEV